LKNNQTSKILPLLSFHDAELTKPILDDTIDLGEFDVNFGTEKKFYMVNPNKDLTAMITLDGKSYSIPPDEGIGIKHIIPPVPVPETAEEHRAFMKASIMGRKEINHTVHCDITWVKAEK